MKNDISGEADDKLVALGMHFPTVPVGIEIIEADEPPLATIGGCALRIGFIPVHPVHCGLGMRAAAPAQMDRMGQKGAGLAHKGAQAALSQSSSSPASSGPIFSSTLA